MLTTSDKVAGWAPDLIIYHDKCADGIVAAWACWKRWGDAPSYLAANYGQPTPDDVAGKNILIVDFSWPERELLSVLEAGAASIVILDHHKTARDALAPFQRFTDKPGQFNLPTVASMIAICSGAAILPSARSST